jgi:tetratricopeptide (TPR) repeat protein
VLRELSFVAGVLALAGCGGASGYTVTRTVGGEQRLGAFVAPHSYENFVLGELALQRGDLARAAEHYELARAGAADDVLLIARLADVRDRLGDRETAERLLDEGERLDRTSEAIWSARGEIAERHGEVEPALDAYARAAESGSEAPTLALARVLRERGASERADAVLERYLEDHPGVIGAARARLSLALARGDDRGAGLAALELARSSEAHADEVAAATRVLLDEGHAPLARRILALIPEGSIPRALRLRAAIESGARQEAEGILATWTPDEPDELVAAARAWNVLGDHAHAVELAEVALERGAGTDARLVIARARLEEGRLADAATLAAAIPEGSSADREARAIVIDALARAGLPALAREIAAVVER